MSRRASNDNIDDLLDKAIAATKPDENNNKDTETTVNLALANFSPSDADNRRTVKFYFNQRFKVGPPTAKSFGQLTFDGFIEPYIPNLLVRGNNKDYRQLKDCDATFIGADFTRARLNSKRCADSTDRKAERFTAISAWSAIRLEHGYTDNTYDIFVRDTGRLDESMIIELPQTDDDDCLEEDEAEVYE